MLKNNNLEGKSIKLTTCKRKNCNLQHKSLELFKPHMWKDKMNCWPFKSSHGDDVVVVTSQQNVYTNPTHESDDTIKELQERNEKLEKVANRARDQLIVSLKLLD